MSALAHLDLSDFAAAINGPEDDSDVMKAPRRSLFAGSGRDLSEARDARHALELAGLDWTVEQRGMFVDDPAGGFPEAPGYVANVHGRTGAVLSVSTSGYVPLQNEAMIEPIDEFLSTGLVKLEHGGEMNGGKRVYLSLRYVDDMMIAGEPIRRRILSLNGHDKGRAWRVLPVPDRIFCTNQLPVYQGDDMAFSARHTENSLALGMERLTEVLASLDAAYTAQKEQAERLAARRFNHYDLTAVLETLWPTASADMGARSVGARQRAQQAVRDLLKEDHNANIAGTAWGVYNAIVEKLDWTKNEQRGGDTFRRNLDRAAAKRNALDVVESVARFN